MAQNLLKAKKKRVAVKKATDGRAASMRPPRKVVLVGTYAGDQLKDWPGYYPYPLYGDDKIDAASAKKVNEIWLFKGTKEPRYFVAECLGVKTREELKALGYPAMGKGHGDGTYLLFKIEKTYAPANASAALAASVESVIIRTKDFAKRSPKVAKQLKAYLESPDRKDAALANQLPSIVTKLPPQVLRVCEAAVQLNFFSLMFPPVKVETPNSLSYSQTGDDNLTMIDLFAGCGGMSLGFELAGFKSVLAVEKDAWASETYAFNRQGVNVVTGDITKIIHPKEQFKSVGEVFGIIGGPPCQGFSLSGDRDPKDPRNSLFMDYMRFVKEFCPSFFVMENVPGILSSVTKLGEPVKDVVVAVANGLGYNVKIIELDAADYGVPQSRHRVFFIGIRSDYRFNPDELVPTKTTHDNPITIRQALSDLPVIQACEGCDSMAYASPPNNAFQEWCRKNSATVENHIAMRHTRRLVARFHVINFGQSAADVPEEHMQRKRGNAAVISGKVYSQNNMRPFPDKPSPTVPASFQSNFVHPLYDRNYTAREGARLQSFPDSYVFRGRRTTMSWEKNLSQYQQIGNAVPPLLAKAIGQMIVSYFKNTKRRKDP